MNHVTKLGAYGLGAVTAFAVALALLVSVSSTPTAEAANVPLANADTSATAAPGDTVQITVTGEFARVTITETSAGVGGSFDHNDGQAIACPDDGSCDADDADNGAVQVDLNIDADASEGFILLSVGGLGATTSTKVINVSKDDLVGDLKLEAASKTISASATTTLTATVLNAASNPAGLNDETVSFTTTLGTLTCNGTTAQVCSDDTANNNDGDPGFATVTLNGGRVEGVATVTATLGSHTASVDVTFFGTAKNLTAEPEQGSVEIGGSVFIVLTVTDGAGNPVSGATVVAGTPNEVVGPDDDAVKVETETDTAASGDGLAGVGYSMDKDAAKAADRIPACGEDNRDSDPDTAGLQELFDTEGTDANGQCVVHVTAPDGGTATTTATRGEHTLNFQVDGAATVKASAVLEVAGKPATITTDAPAMVDAASVTTITVSVWDDEEVLVGITDVKVRKVDGGGLIEDAGDGGTEATSNGQSKFTFIAPSGHGSSEILITAGDANTRITLQIGEAPEEPAPEISVSGQSGAIGVLNAGSLDDLLGALDCGGNAGTTVTIDGNTYVVGAPDVVNAAFLANVSFPIDFGGAYVNCR